MENQSIKIDIEAQQRRKHALESAISKLLLEYTKETCLAISEINVQRFYREGESLPMDYLIHSKLEFLR